MNSEILKKIVAEWLEEKTLPPLVRRDMQQFALEETTDIIAVAGPRRAGKTYYLYLLPHNPFQ